MDLHRSFSRPPTKVRLRFPRAWQDVGKFLLQQWLILLLLLVPEQQKMKQAIVRESWTGRSILYGDAHPPESSCLQRFGRGATYAKLLLSVGPVAVSSSIDL